MATRFHTEEYVELENELEHLKREIERIERHMSQQFTDYEAKLGEISAAVDGVAKEVNDLIARLPAPGAMTPAEDTQFRADMQALVDKIKAIAPEPTTPPVA